MKLKICTLLIAFVALFSAVAATSCEKVRAGEMTAVSEIRSDTTIQQAVRVVSDQTASAVGQSETAWISHRAVREAAMPVRGEPLRICYEEEYKAEEFGYVFAIDGRRSKPPAFSGLGGDHFARADV